MQASRSRQLEERGSVARAAPLHGGPGFGIGQKLSAWPGPAHGAWCSAWGGDARGGLHLPVWLQNSHFLSVHWGLLLNAKFFRVWRGSVPQTIHSYF